MTSLRALLSGSSLAAALCLTSGSAQSAASTLTSIAGARTQIVAVLPTVGRLDLATTLKAAAAKGTRVYLITERATVTKGGYLLNVSHGPQSIQTFLYPGTLPEAWVLVDNAWAVTGAGLDQEGQATLNVLNDSAQLRRMTGWARQVTAAGPVRRPDLLKLRLGR